MKLAYKNNNSESINIRFELVDADIEYLHPLMEHSWGQRVWTSALITLRRF